MMHRKGTQIFRIGGKEAGNHVRFPASEVRQANILAEGDLFGDGTGAADVDAGREGVGGHAASPPS